MIASLIQRMISYFGTDVRRINHALKVYALADCLAKSEQLPENEQLIVAVAAVFHDIGIKEAERKYQSNSGHYQELEGPGVAKELLFDAGLPEDQLNRIYFLIGHHHSYQKIDGPDFQILVEADFLVNCYEDELSKASILSIRQKYFKTDTGIRMIESMFL